MPRFLLISFCGFFLTGSFVHANHNSIRRCFLTSNCTVERIADCQFKVGLNSGPSFDRSTPAVINLSSTDEALAQLDDFQKRGLCPQPNYPNQARCAIGVSPAGQNYVSIVEYAIGGWTSPRYFFPAADLNAAIKLAETLNRQGQCDKLQLGH